MGQASGCDTSERPWGDGPCAQIEGAQADLDNLNPTSSLTDCRDCGAGQSEAEAEAAGRRGGMWSGGVQRHGYPTYSGGPGLWRGDEDAETAVEWMLLLGPESTAG